MFKTLPFAIVLLGLCLLSDASADDAPLDLAKALVGSWAGVEMEGKPMKEGEFNATFNDDGTGSFDGPDGPELFRWTFNKANNRCSILPAEPPAEERFGFTLSFSQDRQTAIFLMDNDKESRLVVKRIQAPKQRDTPAPIRTPPSASQLL